MLHIDPSRYSLEHRQTSSVLDQEVAVITVDGTHSSGKTTALEDYVRDKQLLPDDQCDFGTKHGLTYPYRCVTEEVNGTQVPVVVCSEAAVQYAQMHPDRQLLTTDYNRADQAAITSRAMWHIMHGASMAAYMARKLQPGAANPKGIVLSDRGPLSGFVYANTRLPHERHDTATHSEIFDLTGSPHKAIDLQTYATKFSRLIDLAMLTDYRAIDLEDNGYRSADLKLREQIAQDVQDTYKEQLGEERVVILSGNRQKRKENLQATIRQLIVTKFDC